MTNSTLVLCGILSLMGMLGFIILLTVFVSVRSLAKPRLEKRVFASLLAQEILSDRAQILRFVQELQ